MKCSVLRHPGARPLFALIVGAAIVAASSTVSMAGPAREAFNSRYRCRIIAMLAEIHRNGLVDTSRNRFITLSERDSADRDTQCIFIERDTAMYCEASSGAYHTTDQDGVRDVPLPNVIATMHRLGFRQENSRENLSQTVVLGALPDVTVAADLMLTVLYEAYGTRADTPLVINAPKGGGSDGQCGAPARKRARRPPHSAAST